MLESDERRLRALVREIPKANLDAILQLVSDQISDGVSEFWNNAVKHVREILTEAAAVRTDALLAEIPQWRPIEDAPLDQDVIVAEGDAVGEARHHEGAGWFWAGSHPTDAHADAIYPTHWQPLPAAPGLAEPSAADRLVAIERAKDALWVRYDKGDVAFSEMKKAERLLEGEAVKIRAGLKQ